MPGSVPKAKPPSPPRREAQNASLTAAGFQRIGVRVADIRTSLTAAEATGGEAWGDVNVHTLPNGGEVRIAFVSDPDGTPIELVEGSADGLSFAAVTCHELERRDQVRITSLRPEPRDFSAFFNR